jgi:hypothetical protein
MDFSFASLMGGFIFGVFGFYVYRAGKKRVEGRIIAVGIAMMVYTLFTPTPLYTWGVGIFLSALAYRWLTNP